MSCNECVHSEVCKEIEQLQCRKDFIWYQAESGCPHYKAANVAEVRHGEWLHTEEPLGWRDVDCIECSLCHESWILDDDLCLDDYKDDWKYCPHCGAKMDGKGENDG